MKGIFFQKSSQIFLKSWNHFFVSSGWADLIICLCFDNYLPKQALNSKQSAKGYERIILIAPFLMFCCTMCKILCTYSLVKLLLLLYKVKCNNSAFSGQWKWFKIDQMYTSIYTTFYTMWYVCCCFVSVTNLKSSKEYNSFYLPAAAVLKLIHSIQFQIFFNVMFWKYYFFSKFIFNQ